MKILSAFFVIAVLSPFSAAVFALMLATRCASIRANDSSALSPLHVSGTKIFNAKDEPVRMRGVKYVK